MDVMWSSHSGFLYRGNFHIETSHERKFFEKHKVVRNDLINTLLLAGLRKTTQSENKSETRYNAGMRAYKY